MSDEPAKAREMVRESSVQKGASKWLSTCIKSRHCHHTVWPLRGEGGPRDGLSRGWWDLRRWLKIECLDQNNQSLDKEGGGKRAKEWKGREEEN